MGRIPNGGQNLPLYGSNLVRHDILLIVDETNSLASQMDKIKQTLDDVVAEFDGAMDLRVDLWAVRDYSRADTGATAEDTVRKVAHCLTPRAMAFAIDEIAADAPQHDEAEAYEMAFEEALGYEHIIDRPSLWFLEEILLEQLFWQATLMHMAGCAKIGGLHGMERRRRKAKRTRERILSRNYIQACSKIIWKREILTKNAES